MDKWYSTKLTICIQQNSPVLSSFYATSYRDFWDIKKSEVRFVSCRHRNVLTFISMFHTVVNRLLCSLMAPPRSSCPRPPPRGRSCPGRSPRPTGRLAPWPGASGTGRRAPPAPGSAGPPPSAPAQFSPFQNLPGAKARSGRRRGRWVEPRAG